jgi:deoxyhypusine synthase
LAIKEFIKHHYRHFNAAALVDAAEGYIKLVDAGGKMFVTMGGAMSTAELGLSLAEMIRQDKVHAITARARISKRMSSTWWRTIFMSACRIIAI